MKILSKNEYQFDNHIFYFFSVVVPITYCCNKDFNTCIIMQIGIVLSVERENFGLRIEYNSRKSRYCHNDRFRRSREFRIERCVSCSNDTTAAPHNIVTFFDHDSMNIIIFYQQTFIVCSKLKTIIIHSKVKSLKEFTC